MSFPAAAACNRGPEGERASVQHPPGRACRGCAAPRCGTQQFSPPPCEPLPGRRTRPARGGGNGRCSCWVTQSALRREQAAGRRRHNGWPPLRCPLLGACVECCPAAAAPTNVPCGCHNAAQQCSKPDLRRTQVRSKSSESRSAGCTGPRARWNTMVCSRMRSASFTWCCSSSKCGRRWKTSQLAIQRGRGPCGGANRAGGGGRAAAARAGCGAAASELCRACARSG